MNRRQFLARLAAVGVAISTPAVIEFAEAKEEFTEDDVQLFCPELWADAVLKEYKNNLFMTAFINK